MSDLFFHELGIPEPDVNLNVEAPPTPCRQQRSCGPSNGGPGGEANAVLVVGDVNSTIACGLVSVKLGSS